MKKPIPIPISTAKMIANELYYDEVIIVGAHYESGTQHVTTYGNTVAACENAAKGGNAVKKLLGWPEDMCNAKPARQKRKEKRPHIPRFRIVERVNAYPRVNKDTLEECVTWLHENDTEMIPIADFDIECLIDNITISAQQLTETWDEGERPEDLQFF